MIVIDIGAATWGEDESQLKLIERFSPGVLFAFDPHPDFQEGIEIIDTTTVLRRRAAAWSESGSRKFIAEGLRSRLEHTSVPGQLRVPCFSIVDFFAVLPSNGIVLKLDCEGAEYALLEDLHAAGEDERIKLLLVEWHRHEASDDLRRSSIEGYWRGEVEEWH